MTIQYYTEPDDVYHAQSKKFLSSHMLMEFIESPRQYNRIMTGQAWPQGDNENFKFGAAFHMAVLQPELFAKTYTDDGDAPINPKTGKPYGDGTQKYAEWLSTLPSGTNVLSREKLNIIENMRDGIYRNPDAKRIFDVPFYAEHVVRKEIFGIQCQGKMDHVCETNQIEITDMKTTGDIRKFKYDIDSFMYLYQMAFYYLLGTAEFSQAPLMSMIACSKKEPWDCQVWCVLPETLEIFINGGIYKHKPIEGIKNAIARIKECQAKNIWPTGLEGVEWI